MHCKQCGHEFKMGLTKCPNCNANIHYWGKTKIIEGVEQSTLSIRDIFSGLWENHIPGAGDRMFIAGTPLTTPKPEQMLQEWEKPWLYSRVLFLGIVFLLLSNYLHEFYGLKGGYLTVLVLGSLLVPMSVVLFYWELNIPRDIPLYKVFLVFFIGGVMSLIFTVSLPQIDGPAYVAPFTEEPGKILALALFLYFMDCKYIFSGLLIGAAVGAGFAAFEDIEYVVRTEFSRDNFYLRAILTIGGHVTWAAIEGGALMWAKGREKLQLKHFVSPKFLVYVVACMALHFIWNTDIEIQRLPYYLNVKHLILCAIAVALAFTLINKAIAQILLVVNTAPMASSSTPRQANFVMTALAGPMKGNKFELKIPLTIGRDPSTCNVILPPNTAGVSRRHCKIEKHLDGIYIMDVGSSKGTFMQGQRLIVNQWYKVTGNFYLGSPNVMFSVN